MPLRGELNSVDLAHVFQMLVLNQKAGTLEIHHEGVQRGLYFTAQGVSVPFERDLLIKRAVRSLIRSGAVSSEQVERARHNMAVLDADHLHTLVQMRAITEEQRIQSLREQLEEEVYELFFIPAATFEFRDGDTDGLPGEVDPELTLSPNGIIMEAARRNDEWEFISRLVPSGADIVERVGDLSLIEERARNPELEAVVEAVDGILTIDDIMHRCGMSRFVAMRGVAMLLERGVIGSVPVDELVTRATKRLESGDPASASKLFERAISAGADAREVLTGAGEALESLGKHKEAAARYMAAGKCAEESSDLSDAVMLYQRIRLLLPSHVEARQRLFALHKVARVHLQSSYKPEEEGWALAAILAELDRGDAILAVVSGLLDLAGDDPRRIERVAERAAGMGLSSFAVDAYLLAADHRSRKRDNVGALAALRRAQSIDPSHADIASRVAAFGVAVAKDSARRRSWLRGVVMVGGFALLSFGYSRFSQAALESFGEWSVEDFVASREFDKGKEHYAGVIRRYPCTIPFLLSFEKIRELEVAERHSAEVERYRAQVTGASREDRIHQAETLRKGALAARHSGDWTQAAELLKKARDLTGPDDPLELDASLAELMDYLAQARRLKSEAMFYRNAGRFTEAHARLVSLVTNYAHSDAANGVTLPVRIESDVAATIYRDGEPLRLMDGMASVVAETPFVLDLPAGTEANIELRRDGYVSYPLRVSPLKQATLRVELPRPAGLQAILPDRIIAAPVTDGDVVAVAMDRGKVAALDAARLSVRWIESLPRLAEVIGSPWIDGGAVVVATSLGELVAIRGRGAVQVLGALPKRPTGGAVVSDSILCIPLEGNALAVGRVGAFALVVLPAKRTTAPQRMSGGRFAVGCDDGQVWIVTPGGALSSLPDSAGTAAVTALAVRDDWVLVGQMDGQLSVHLEDHLVRRVQAFEGPVLGISAAARFLVLAGSEELALVDLDALAVVNRRPGTFLISDAPDPQRVIAARSADGLVLSLSRSDLSTTAVHAAESGPLLAGIASGQRVYHASVTGKVVGILYPRP